MQRARTVKKILKENKVGGPIYPILILFYRTQDSVVLA